MRTFIKNGLFAAAALLLGFSCATAPKNNSAAEIPTVKDFEIGRYLGKWYEIARLPMSFEKDLVGVTATYSLSKNGKVEVLNEGYKYSLSGKKKSAKGRAYNPDPNNKSYLKVTFFWPFYGDYRIIELDHVNYGYAMVTSSTKNYLWILSRSPRMDDGTYNRLVENARALGFPVEKLYKTPQKAD